MPPAPDQLSRHARQQVMTELLFGVDFVPARPGAPTAAATPPAPPDAPTRAATVTAVKSSTGAAAALAELEQRHDATCPHCTTATAHTRTVFGEGSPVADLMFIGEAPGAEEDRTGRPFVGRAGQKLDEIIRAMGMERKDVYIANVLKSRPPENRTPQADEVEGCSPFLREQIRIIRPRVIVTLGGPATKLMLETSIGITKLRGQWAEYLDSDLVIPIMPTFHPAYLLRNYTKDTRQKMWSDMQAVMDRLREE